MDDVVAGLDRPAVDAAARLRGRGSLRFVTLRRVRVLFCLLFFFR